VLDAFIIEELKRRERRQESEPARPQPSLPVPSPAPEEADEQPRQSDDDKPERGVVIIDYSV
jgi:hypothetical protein